MKMMFLFIILLSFSCKNQQEETSSQLDSITIASNEDTVSDGNGGTGIDAREIYAAATTINFPTYTNHLNTLSKYTRWKFTIIFSNRDLTERINHIKFNGDIVPTTGTVNLLEVVFETTLPKATYLQNFSINSINPIKRGAIKSIKVHADDNLFYSAINLDDSRAELYTQTNDLVLTISDISCPSPKHLNFNGQCIQNFILCSDYSQVGIDNWCKIKRDDNKLIFCSPTASDLDCQLKTEAICSLFNDSIQYDGQMFWGEINSDIVKNIQCPK